MAIHKVRIYKIVAKFTRIMVLYMINVLFSSLSGGTKNFEFNGTVFGWRAIQASLRISILIAAELYVLTGYV